MNASLLATNTVDASNTERGATPIVEATKPTFPQVWLLWFRLQFPYVGYVEV